jgi:hypothetical protein
VLVPRSGSWARLTAGVRRQFIRVWERYTLTGFLVNGRFRRQAFEAGKIIAGDDNIRRLDGLLRALARQYRARKAEREQDLNGKLRKLEETKIFLAGLWDIEALLCSFEVETPQIISRLSDAVEHGIDFLKNEKEQRKVRCEDPETTLFMNLRDVYIGLSGKTGISNDGPLLRFANACTRLIDVSIVRVRWTPSSTPIRVSLFGSTDKSPPMKVARTITSPTSVFGAPGNASRICFLRSMSGCAAGFRPNTERKPGLHRLSAGGRWIRTIGPWRQALP